MDQPFANFVRQLFAVQDYPDLRQYPEGRRTSPTTWRAGRCRT